jgi:hypothetical protein
MHPMVATLCTLKHVMETAKGLFLSNKMLLLLFQLQPQIKNLCLKAR